MMSDWPLTVYCASGRGRHWPGTTKIPILLGQDLGPFQLRQLSYYGFWGFAHETRTDFAMIMGSLFLFLVGPGSLSFDERRARR